jgi:hypothetical protein
MSPSRTRKPVLHTRPRSEVVTAVLVGVGIVVGTALLIWLMRPGGAVGTGGLFNRQPRVTWLVVFALAALGLGIWWLVRGGGSRRHWRKGVAIGLVCVVVFVGTFLAAILWPSGLIHHYPTAPKLTPNSTPTQTQTTLPAPQTTKSPPTTKGK